MDLTNLRNHQDELINHMKDSGYSMSCIYMYKRQIREILELDMDSWTSYKDIYQYFESISANKKDLNWRRSVIGGIEHFDLEHLFPDRRRICSFIEPKGAYYATSFPGVMAGKVLCDCCISSKVSCRILRCHR